MITRNMIQDMFDNMRENTRIGKADWSIDNSCLWGYFFTDYDRDKLLAVVPALKESGYRLVGILESSPDNDDEDDGLLYLHVEKEERHTVESLYQRNQELYRFAEQFDLVSYDGMDAGAIHETKEPEANTVTFVCSHIFKGEMPVLFVSRADGDWQFLCGAIDHENESPHIVSLEHIVSKDKTLQDILDLPEDWEIERQAVGGQWHYSNCEFIDEGNEE